MSSRRGDRGADLVAGHDRDVVDREHVGRVGHRDQQRAVVDEGDRAPPGSAWRRAASTRLAAAMSTWKTLQVEVVEPEALGDRARELVLRDRALVEQHGARASSPAARALSMAASTVSRLGEAELDDDVGEEAPSPRRDVGVVMPFQSAGGSACARAPVIAPVGTGLRWDGLSVISLARPPRTTSIGHLARVLYMVQATWTAARIASRGASQPVQRSNDSAPWRTRISSPSTTAPRCRCGSSAVPPSR